MTPLCCYRAICSNKFYLCKQLQAGFGMPGCITCECMRDSDHLNIWHPQGESFASPNRNRIMGLIKKLFKNILMFNVVSRRSLTYKTFKRLSQQSTTLLPHVSLRCSNMLQPASPHHLQLSLGQHVISLSKSPRHKGGWSSRRLISNCT